MRAVSDGHHYMYFYLKFDDFLSTSIIGILQNQVEMHTELLCHTNYYSIINVNSKYHLFLESLVILFQNLNPEDSMKSVLNKNLNLFLFK